MMLLAFFAFGQPALALQEPQPGPVYVVQTGDTLWDIAVRFGVTLDALQAANNITDPGQLGVGDALVIPGLEGISGVLTTVPVTFGESLHSLARRYSVPTETLVRLNHVTSPAELYAGSILVIPQLQDGGQPVAQVQATLAAGQSLLELAAMEGVNPWMVAAVNQFTSTWSALPGQVLGIPSQSNDNLQAPGALPGAIAAVSLEPAPFVQGKAAEVVLQASDLISITGSLAGRPLNFFPADHNVLTTTQLAPGSQAYVAMQGIHAMTEPGLYPLLLRGRLANGAEFAFSQAVSVRSGDYPYDPVLVVSPETIDPAVTRPEDAQWLALVDTASPDKLWEGVFQSPAPAIYADCWPSKFGSRRSYNGSAYTYFHTGLDFCGGVGTEILAPAAGVVVFAGPLTVRGNATMIDHGWGVYSGYMHQSEILVKPGERVEAGQIIGKVGGTGRVTGPHLHFEIFVGGVQVDPLDWLLAAHP
jgi:murein DD-endopeptidase MepM/ murein hydrolase activator NlpD